MWFRVFCVVYDVSVGLVIELLFAWCLCLVYVALMREGAVPALHVYSIWWLALQRHRHPTPTHADLEGRGGDGG